MGTALPVFTGRPHSLRPEPVHGREAFVQLRRSRRRSWSGPVRVQFLPAQGTDEIRRVAFAVPRKVGSAVERNLFRRRLRAITVEAAAVIAPGAYLVGVDKGVRDLPFQELEAKVIEAMQRASQVGPR